MLKERWRLPSTENPRASLGYQLYSSDREMGTESATREILARYYVVELGPQR